MTLLCDDKSVPARAARLVPLTRYAVERREREGRSGLALTKTLRSEQDLSVCIHVYPRLFFGLLNVLLAACGRDAGWYPIPPQQSLDLGPDPGGVGPSVKMADPDANDYIVRDIGLMPGTWRWAFLHPELRFRVAHPEGIRFAAEIHIPEVTFKVTGPVVVTYAVDGRRLGFVRCDHPGTYTIDHPVPAAWLAPAAYIHLEFDADRHWVSPDDGAQLSFLLLSAGFIQ
jgi:hypothetical protein